MKQRTTIVALFIAVVTAVGLTTPASVWAEDGLSPTAPPKTSTSTQSRDETRVAPDERADQHRKDTDKSQGKENRVKAEDARADLREKLDDAKKKVCKNHERQITKIMSDISKRNQKRFDMITTVYERADAFYKKAGHTLANYDQLVANVETAKAAAKQALTANIDSSSFKCDGPMPRQALQDFRTSREGAIKALKTYRDTVKALIAGIKSVQPSAKPVTAQPTQKPETNKETQSR